MRRPVRSLRRRRRWIWHCRCTVGFEILAAAQDQQSITFRIGVFNPGISILYLDETPRNNVAHLDFGTAIPVPAASTLSWLLLATLMIVVGLHQRRLPSFRPMQVWIQDVARTNGGGESASARHAAGAAAPPS